MRCAVAVFVREVAFSGRCSVRVRCCVVLLVVETECSTRVVRVCGGVNDDVAIKYGS